jgi:heme/copper-type cytochrome/quinol oxidase subunit 3
MENKTMMKLLIGSEGFFFLCLIMAFIYLGYNSGFERVDLEHLNIKTSGIFTIFLISSSFTLIIAERQYTAGKKAGLKIWLIITILLGGVFLVGQGLEYMNLIKSNITLESSVFGTSFFALTGFHGLHVFIGLIILSILLLLAFIGDFDRPGSSVIGTVAIYWHFVDIVWLFVFCVVYVLPLFTRL